MCLFFVMLLLGPRAAIVFWWLFEPARWSTAFTTFIVPFLGFLILPWTTLMWVIVAPLGTATDFDWLWLALAFVVDVSTLAGGGYSNRNRMPGYSS